METSLVGTTKGNPNQDRIYTVIIENRSGQNRVVESRAMEFGSSIPPTWAQFNGKRSSSGRYVTSNDAITVPTVIGCLQLVAATAAALPILVYQDLGDHKKPMYDIWQYMIMETYPGPNTDPFQLKHDLFWSLETCGNAFALKVKDPKSQVPIEMIVLDPDMVAIRNEKGEKRFDIKLGSNKVFKGATVNEILHIKQLPKAGSMFSGTCGLQLITERLGAEISATEWEGRFFRNDATPPLVITLGEDAGPDEMREAYDAWMMAHSGDNSGTPAVIAGGAKVEKLGFNLAEAQLVEAHGFNVLEFARGMNLPLTMFVPPHTKASAAEDEALMYSIFYLSPRLRRFESALNSDPDFFAYNNLWCRFDERQMMRANTTAMALANHSYVQDGVLVPDEVRAELGYDPLPPLMSLDEMTQNPGKIPQITPVGGAPNDPTIDEQLVAAVNKKDDN